VTDGRKRAARVFATLCITALGSSVLVAAPTYGTPDIGDVQQRVDTLYRQAEQASERYNAARLEMRQAQTRLAAVDADLRRQQAKVDAVRAQVADAVIAQYQGQALTSTSRVLLSDNPDAFLQQLSTVAEYNDQRTQMMADFAVEAKRLELRRAASSRELARIAATKRQLGADKRQVDEKAAEAKRLLTTLKARAAAAKASRSQTRTPTTSADTTTDTGPGTGSSTSRPLPPISVPVSGRAAAAVRYALAQVGHAYVYGADGPGAFDCSGLTMRAWAQAGVGLPHSSSAQTGSGTPVSESELRPGDLVFYYSPVSHVGMYIGHGQIVNAENPSVGVKITGVNSMPYAGAVRPG
jgi:cell wall-associated NlpC family hydrolase